MAHLVFIALLATPFLALLRGSRPFYAGMGDYPAVTALPAGGSARVLSGRRQEIGRQIIKVDVSLVTVPVIVADSKGNYIPDLKESDFHVFENGVEQKIERLIPEVDPFNVVLMIDSSGSTHFKLEEMQNAASVFVDALRPQDRLMIVSFDSEVYFDSDFTVDRARLRQSILRAHNTGSRTRLYDALNLVTKRRLSRVPGRKAIVLFTDGVDNESLEAGSADTLATIEKSDVLVYAIQYDTRKDGMSDRFHVPLPPGYVSFSTLYGRAVKYLGNLSSHSGGRLYHAETIVSLKDAFSQIATELRRQYTLCYYPANQKRDGSFRRLRVKVDVSGAKVRARTGYRAEKSTD